MAENGRKTGEEILVVIWITVRIQEFVRIYFIIELTSKELVSF